MPFTVRPLIALALLVLTPPAAAAQATADDVFNDAVLHDIRLFVHPRDWASLKANFQLDDYYPAHVVWNGRTLRNVAIRSRGFGSRSPVKPGLRIDFDRYDRTQTLVGLTSVVLRNNTQDPSSMHERLSMKVFAAVGIPAPRTAHARLFVNNEYAGLYLIVESIDTPFLARHFGESAGYLYKYDWVAPYYLEYRGPDPASYTPLPFTPETHVRDPDPAPLVEMIRTITEAPADEFQARAGAVVDVPAFMRQAAVENVLADNDGLIGYAGMNNFYLYRFQSRPFSTFVPWDKSEAFKGGPAFSILANIADAPEWARNRLMDRAMAVPELRDLYLDTLVRCADLITADAWLETEILRVYEQIRQAALDDHVMPFSDEDFEQDVAQLLEFARSRGAFVRADVARSR